MPVSALPRADGGALLPELLWALADAWKPKRHALAEAPMPGGVGARLALGLGELDTSGWVAGGALAAAALSAPVVVGSGAPPDFYVPNETEARAARRELHGTVHGDQRACTVAAAPPLLWFGLAIPRARWPHRGSSCQSCIHCSPRLILRRIVRAGRDTRRLDTTGSVHEVLVNETPLVLAGESVASMVRAAE